ncbi:MAG TPA: histidine phosphatase family protein [Micromonosporaceae bacterium]|nr:histidine phosphatase family protein [Micromonosporaceae bacterium]
MGVLTLVRHGQTEWSATRRHTSYTDLDLTAHGETEARGLASRLAARSFAAVLCSPRRRARRTADLAGLTVSAVDEDLVEWDYGEYEGITTADIRTRRPDWDLWSDGCPGGEQPEQVAARLDRVLARARPLLADGDVALVAHGHALRVAGARWIGAPPALGGRLRLDTGTTSTLGHEHDRQVILEWNRPVR